MTDSTAIDTALVDRLAGDATLSGLLPDGVFFDVAPQGALRFLHLALFESRDEWAQGTPGARRIAEECIFLVQAAVQEPSAVVADAAAVRIDELLEDQPLTIVGYYNHAIHRVQRIRSSAPDAADASLRWQYRGGRYRVAVTPLSAGRTTP